MSTFEHLDDPHPPALDDDGWRRVRDRSRVLTRRRRLARATTSAAVLVVVAALAAVGWSVAANRHDDRIAAVGTSTTTPTVPPTSVTVRLEIDHTVVNQGQDVTGSVVFDNRSQRAVQPDFTYWRVVVGSGTAKPVTWRYSLAGGAVSVIRPGITRSAFRATTRQLSASCVEADSVLSCGALLPPGPARVWFLTNGAAANVTLPSPVAVTISGRGGPPPQPEPCPVPSPEPSMVTGQYCGPVPPAGNGLGPNGECTGRETTVPCAAGVVPGKYYAFTLPGRCDGVIIFDGRRWISELPPPTVVSDFDVWMRLDPNGRLGFIGPRGVVGFDPDTGQPASNCQN